MAVPILRSSLKVPVLETQAKSGVAPRVALEGLAGAKPLEVLTGTDSARVLGKSGDRGDFGPINGAPPRPIRQAKEVMVTETPVSLGEALKAAETLLRGPRIDRPIEAQDANGVILYDPASVNNKKDVVSESNRYRAALSQVKRNAPLEQTALAKMPASEQLQYQSIREGLGHDEVATLSLQALLLQKRFTSAKDLVEDGTLLGHLAEISDPKFKFGPGVDRSALLGSIVQEVQMPSSTSQQIKATCAATTIAILLAREHPAEYVRLLKGLSDLHGKVTLASGDVLTRERGTTKNDHSYRSSSQELIAPAFMEYANPNSNYRNGEDHQVDGKGHVLYGGLNVEDVNHLMTGVYNRPFQVIDSVTLETQSAAWDALRAQIKRGQPAPVGVEWQQGGHKLLVTDIKGTGRNEAVYYINPWGQEERLPKADFLRRLHNLNLEVPSTPK